MKTPDFILIDDDKIMLFLIELEIKKHFKNCISLSFTKADDAVRYIQENKSELTHSIILLDLNMPVMNGFQVLEILNLNSTELKVIIVTSSISEDDKAKTMGYSFVLDYMNKPIKGLDLQSLLMSNMNCT
ncbi:response regulator [Flavobacterium sp. NG2]|uniref:response regulator n=1 Tax=Flavobacterium sp. NG2 TaxID=3097547 RepID=UPI002A7EB7C4|nr:response regulator [Flavobacterium sp. NG2]WPR71920.1 response regulator [Flavobacterium sp. NG2]